MKYILTTDYDVTKVKNNMVNMWNPISDKECDWYMYLHPEYHYGFKCIHKSNVILEAPNLKTLTKLIKANDKLFRACLKAWKN